MYKRSISFLLAFIMLFTSILGVTNVEAYSKEKVSSTINPKIVDLVRDFDLKNSEKFKEYEKAYKEQNEEKVRILVEVDEESVLDIMNKKQLSYDSLSPSSIRSVERSISSANDRAISKLRHDDIDLKVLSEYDVAFSGFAAEIERKDLEAVKKALGAKKVSISNKYILERPTMISSHDMINDKNLWTELDYKGEGMIVAVLDSGTDIDHKDFKLTNPNKAALTPEKLRQIKNEQTNPKRLPGEYKTPKVPYGWNYFDGNANIKDIGPSASEHGMHVAGTVGANGDKVKGVAPEAQILGMKVFGNDPLWGTTFDDVYLDAIEDAIVLGADALNMSLGSPAGFDDLNSILDQTITKAVNSGIVCALAAGNESHIYYGYKNRQGMSDELPFASDPDYGVLGTPSIYENTISVASINNSKVTAEIFYYGDGKAQEVIPLYSYIFNGKAALEDVILSSDELHREFDEELLKGKVYFKNNDSQFIDMNGDAFEIKNLPETVKYYKTATDFVEAKLVGSKQENVDERGFYEPYHLQQGNVESLGTLEFVHVGLGRKGTIDEGSNQPYLPDGSFVDDYKNVDVNGKIALVARGESTFADKAKKAEEAGAKAVIIYNYAKNGDEVLKGMQVGKLNIPLVGISHVAATKLLKANSKTITFTREVKQFVNSLGGRMSNFSSMGPTPILRLKPELTAPGGEIYSTLNDQKYGVMGGTSMATPHVAGGSALVQEYLKDKFKDLNPGERAKLVKILLMNTARIVEDEFNVPYSVRKQGAGLMNLSAAVETPAYVLADSNGKTMPKIELKTLDSPNFNVDFEIFGLKDSAEYDVKVLATKEQVKNGLYQMKQELIPAEIYGATQVRVAKGSSFKGRVSVSIPTLERNNYLDGWIIFDSKDEKTPDLVLPFIGFYGDWDGLRIFDDFQYSNNVKDSKYGLANPVHIMMQKDKPVISGPSDNVAFSPTQGASFGKPNVVPVFTLFRNVENLSAEILDKDGRHVRTLIQDVSLRKNYYNNGRGKAYYLSGEFIWDGKGINDELVPDGVYTYKLSAKNVNGNKIQTKEFKTMVDTVSPTIAEFKVDQASKKATLYVEDNAEGSGVEFAFVTMQKMVGNTPEQDILASTKPFILAQNDPRIKSLGNNRYELDIAELFGDKYIATNSHKFLVHVFDKARNYMVKADDQEGNYEGKSDKAEIYIAKPDRQDISKENRVLFTGYVLTDEDLKLEAIRDGQVLLDFSRMTKDGAIDVLDPATGKVVGHEPGYRFSENLNLKDGVNDILFKATDKKTNTFLDSVKRTILVDSVLPTISNVSYEQIEGTNDLRITLTVKEQNNYFRVNVDGSHVYTHGDIDFKNVRNIEETVTFIAKNVRPNFKELNIEVYDIADNKQTQKMSYNIQDNLPADRTELDNLLKELISLNLDDYNKYGKKLIEGLIQDKSDYEKITSRAEVEDAVKKLKSIKRALVTKEEEKNIKVNLNAEAITATFGKPMIRINPEVISSVRPYKYYRGSEHQNMKNIGYEMLFEPSTKKIKLTFVSQDDIDMFDYEEEIDVKTIDLPHTISFAYVASSKKVGETIMITANLFKDLEKVQGETLKLVIYNSKNTVVYTDSQETNAQGAVIFNYTIPQNAEKGNYTVEISYPNDTRTIPVKRTFKVN